MRLSILDNGHRARARLFMRATSGDAPDIVRTLLYRPDFLARPLLAITVPAMRGESYWTAAEREYLAMSTAELYRCPFCMRSHAELTRIAGHGEIDAANPDSARAELRAVREFLAAVSIAPDTADATPVAGLPDHAVREALAVNLVWNVVNRLANAFGFELRGDQLRSGTRPCTGSATGSRGSCSPAATARTSVTSSRTSATRCSWHPRSRTPPGAPRQRPAASCPNRGRPTPRWSGTRPTGSPTPTSPGSPRPDGPRTRSTS